MFLLALVTFLSVNLAPINNSGHYRPVDRPRLTHSIALTLVTYFTNLVVDPGTLLLATRYSSHQSYTSCFQPVFEYLYYVVAIAININVATLYCYRREVSKYFSIFFNRSADIRRWNLFHSNRLSEEE